MSNALDLCLVDIDDRIVVSVPLSTTQHAELIHCAKSVLDCPVLMRISDYYRDALISGEDVAILAGELERLWSVVRAGEYEGNFMRFLPEFLGVILMLRSLCDEARREGLNLSARAL